MMPVLPFYRIARAARLWPERWVSRELHSVDRKSNFALMWASCSFPGNFSPLNKAVIAKHLEWVFISEFVLISNLKCFIFFPWTNPQIIIESLVPILVDAQDDLRFKNFYCILIAFNNIRLYMIRYISLWKCECIKLHTYSIMQHIEMKQIHGFAQNGFYKIKHCQ